MDLIRTVEWGSPLFLINITFFLYISFLLVVHATNMYPMPSHSAREGKEGMKGRKAQYMYLHIVLAISLSACKTGKPFSSGESSVRNRCRNWFRLSATGGQAS